MSLASPHNGARWRRWLSSVCLLGVACLAVSLAGSGWMMHFNAGPAGGGGGGGTNPAALCCIGHVDVEAGVSYPYPTNPGRVVAVKVHEGDAVKEGAVLFRIDDRAARNSVKQADLALKTARLAVKRAANDRVELEKAVQAQQKAVESAEQTLEVAKVFATQIAEAKEKGGVSPDDAMRAALGEKVARANAEAEKGKLAALKVKAANIDLAAELARDDITEKGLLLDRAQLALDECEVKAPAAGKVLRLSLQVGDLLTAEAKSQPLVFCPSGPRIVRAEVEQEWIDLVKEDQLVTFQDDTSNDKGETWTGKVTRVSDWMAHRRSILPDPSQMHDVRTLECVVAIDPNQNPEKPLRIGQRVRVSLLKK